MFAAAGVVGTMGAMPGAGVAALLRKAWPLTEAVLCQGSLLSLGGIHRWHPPAELMLQEGLVRDLDPLAAGQFAQIQKHSKVELMKKQDRVHGLG